MKIISKIDRAALEEMENRAGRLISIRTKVDLYDRYLFLELKDFWASNSERVLIEKSLSHAASTLLKEGMNLLESSKPDKLKLLSQLKEGVIDRNSVSDQDKGIVIKVCEWQLHLILSQSDVEINSVPILIEFCLKRAALTKAILFGKS
ncbi:hypothetical protein R69619_03712 [Paraburkholderia nemoris]|uniref:hypothetical protein n=1 Tax=Paraburkholderia nemoris TaxID=2793076 RepID=UPI00190D2245|nr:hypothetical protein [Paraburkholderia nemoris]MBK3744189.1 hypothetical protein [Paraburkholderia aspalathi]CAE6768115.1 hypothetical protein R69619_03712 [Paraburkholderia nemoris]